ncbi:hypothetical protein WKW79_17155 [Variovorax robiniae]|uniref:DUF2845 domain-containing protein n=1 Tax=Variovorax robiniae TaxID=1836199 RepID=A0ABU8XCD0_9BURK
MIAALLATAAGSVLAADAAERKFIREGMAEGEVLVKIGKPDYESVVSGGAATVVEKKWTYMPAPRDEQTLTTVTIKNGR